MVGVHRLGEDEGALELGQEGFGDQTVVQTPTLVVGAGIGPVGPPGVVVGVLVEVSETVDKSTA